jgi:hypothetical protein
MTVPNMSLVFMVYLLNILNRVDVIHLPIFLYSL